MQPVENARICKWDNIARCISATDFVSGLRIFIIVDVNTAELDQASIKPEQNIK